MWGYHGYIPTAYTRSNRDVADHYPLSDSCYTAELCPLPLHRSKHCVDSIWYAHIPEIERLRVIGSVVGKSCFICFPEREERGTRRLLGFFDFRTF